jgi:hypothetical protein
MQQIDYRHYLENAVRWEHPFTISTALESFIPQEMLAVISSITDIPLYDAYESTYDFLRYMNGHSIYPITYKFTGSSRSKEFYRYYPTNMEVTMTDLSTDEGEMNNNVMSQYQITFSIKMEFNSTGFYYMFSNKIYDIKLPKIDGENTDVIPIYTDILLKEDLNLRQGWHLYNRASLRLDDPNDHVNINQMLNASINAGIDYHLKNGLPLFDLIDLKVRKQGKLVHNGGEYTIDWKTRELYFHNQDCFHTYTILVCINIEYVNQLMKDVYKLE